MPGKRKIIYIFGNPMLDFDNLPLKLVLQLKKIFPEIDFMIADPNENLKPVNRKLIIIDSVEGIEKVTLIENLDQLKIEKKYSLHDLDLAFNLKLLQKIGKLEKVKILGVPMKGDEKEILEQLEKWIRLL